jgi:hypothetical protein
MHVAVARSIHSTLLPNMKLLTEAVKAKQDEFDDIVKIGRTHLQVRPSTYALALKSIHFEINLLELDLVLLKSGHFVSQELRMLTSSCQVIILSAEAVRLCEACDRQ